MKRALMDRLTLGKASGIMDVVAVSLYVIKFCSYVPCMLLLASTATMGSSGDREYERTREKGPKSAR